MFKKISASWFLILAIAAVLWVPHLFALGMFMDGLEDALLAQSLYKGIATFWAPQSYANSYSWGTPPLGLYVLSVCYKIFGDAYYVERFFSFASALVQLALITLLWRSVFAKDEVAKKYSWLPGLLWIISPLIGWSYSYNLLDSTMALFTTLAMMVALKYCYTQRYPVLSAAAGAVFVLLAVITKGPVAFFVFALPVLFIGVSKGYTVKRALFFSVLQVLFFAGFFFILFAQEVPRNFLNHYLEVQIKPALNYDPAQQESHFVILAGLLKAVSFYMLLAAIYFVLRKKITRNDSAVQQSYWRFILLGLCGSVPIILSAKQKSFYLLPAMVPLAIGFAAYLLPLSEWAKTKLREQHRLWVDRAIRTGSVITILLCIFLCISTKGEIIRDEDMLNDLRQSHALIKSGELIRADAGFYGEWSLQAYSLRLYNNRICPGEQVEAHFFMTRPGQRSDNLPANAQKVFSGKTFDLFQL